MTGVRPMSHPSVVRHSASVPKVVKGSSHSCPVSPLVSSMQPEVKAQERHAPVVSFSQKRFSVALQVVLTGSSVAAFTARYPEQVGGTHAPFAQLGGPPSEVHTCPHDPQLFGSVCRFTQATAPASVVHTFGVDPKHRFPKQFSQRIDTVVVVFATPPQT